MSRRKVLKELLRSRLGHFVPSETRFLLGKDWTLDHGGLRYLIVQPPNTGDKTAIKVANEVKPFTHDHFYKEAVIPKSLGLADPDKDSM